MDEGRESKIEVEVGVHQEKADFINHAYGKGLQYRKRAALESVSTKNEPRELTELAPRKLILVRKTKNQKVVNNEEIIFNLKSQYSAHNSENRTFIPNILCEEPCFEEITDNLKTFSKSIKEGKNLGLKDKSLICGWLLMAANIYIQQNLSRRFKDWLYEQCRIKRQTYYNYINLWSVAPKLMKSRVRVTFFKKKQRNYI